MYSTFMLEHAVPTLERWIDSATKEVSHTGRVGNVPTMAVLHGFVVVALSNMSRDDWTVETVSKWVGSLAYVRGRHAFGQTLRNINLNVEEHADPKKVEKVVLQQLVRFLQAEGVDTSRLDGEHLKRYLTGEPLWFVSGDRVLRIPLAGISRRSSNQIYLIF